VVFGGKNARDTVNTRASTDVTNGKENATRRKARADLA